MSKQYMTKARAYIGHQNPSEATVKRVARLMEEAEVCRDKAQRFTAWKKLQDFVRKAK